MSTELLGLGFLTTQDQPQTSKIPTRNRSEDNPSVYLNVLKPLDNLPNRRRTHTLFTPSPFFQKGKDIFLDTRRPPIIGEQHPKEKTPDKANDVQTRRTQDPSLEQQARLNRPVHSIYLLHGYQQIARERNLEVMGQLIQWVQSVDKQQAKSLKNFATFRNQIRQWVRRQGLKGIDLADFKPSKEALLALPLQALIGSLYQNRLTQGMIDSLLEQNITTLGSLKDRYERDEIDFSQTQRGNSYTKVIPPLLEEMGLISLTAPQNPVYSPNPLPHQDPPPIKRSGTPALSLQLIMEPVYDEPFLSYEEIESLVLDVVANADQEKFGLSLLATLEFMPEELLMEPWLTLKRKLNKFSNHVQEYFILHAVQITTYKIIIYLALEEGILALEPERHEAEFAKMQRFLALEPKEQKLLQEFRKSLITEADRADNPVRLKAIKIPALIRLVNERTNLEIGAKKLANAAKDNDRTRHRKNKNVPRKK